MNDQGQTNQSLPASPTRAPGLPGNFDMLTFEGYSTLNTKAARPAIRDDEAAIMDNFIPLGKNNLQTMYNVSAPQFTRSSGSGSIAYFAFGNIADTPSAFIFQGDGSIIQHNTTTMARTSIAPPGTIVTPAAQIGVAQWGSQYVIMVAPQTNGYFLYDGVAFYRAGTVGPQVTLLDSGNGYTGPPTMVATGGTGTGATFTATVASGGSVSQIFVATPGSGYTATDAAFIAFSGGGGPSTAIASTSIAGGHLVGISMANNGSGYGAQTVATVIGGGGVGATVAVTAVSGGVTGVSISNQGQGYLTRPTVLFSDPNSAIAVAELTLMPFGVQGTCVETFSKRVWIGNGAAPSTPPVKSLIQFSGPGDPADFDPANGAGAFVATDSFTRVGYHAMKQTNGFLYLIGDSSVNTISGVQTNNGVTTFSNQNIDPQIGSPWPDSVQVFGRAVPFGNTFGVHALYGGAVQKVSANLDGVYTTVPATGSPPSYGGLLPSAAVCLMFGIHVYVMLLPIIDQVTGVQTNKLLCWDGKAWFTASQSVDITRIAAQEIDSVLTAWGSDGVSLYKLFNQPSNLITKTVQSRFWDQPSYLAIKRVQNVLGMFESKANDAVAFTVTADSEFRSIPKSITNVFSATWSATGGVPAVWTATGGATVTWQTLGIVTFINEIENSGSLLGTTLTTNAMDVTLLSLALTAQRPYDWRL